MDPFGAAAQKEGEEAKKEEGGGRRWRHAVVRWKTSVGAATVAVSRRQLLRLQATRRTRALLICFASLLQLQLQRVTSPQPSWATLIRRLDQTKDEFVSTALDLNWQWFKTLTPPANRC